MVVALVALVVLAFAVLSLARLSRSPRAAPSVPEARTFASLDAGDVVLTPGADWLVESRREEAEKTTVFTLRSGRTRRMLVVAPEGALRFGADASETEPLERSAVELIARG